MIVYIYICFYGFLIIVKWLLQGNLCLMIFIWRLINNFYIEKPVIRPVFCLKEFQEYIKSASSNFKDVSASTSTAVGKLDKLINVISNYHAVKIGGGWLD